MTNCENMFTVYSKKTWSEVGLLIPHSLLSTALFPTTCTMYIAYIISKMKYWQGLNCYVTQTVTTDSLLA